MARKSVISETPIMFGPSLAVLVGVEAAIIIQRIEFLCQDGIGGGRVIDGDRWIWNTYEDWQKNHFPFWSVRTVQRTIQRLEDKGWLLSKQPDGKMSRKKYYRVSTAFKQRATLEEAAEHANLASSEGASLASSEHANLAPSVTESTTESSSERTEGCGIDIPHACLRESSKAKYKAYPTSEKQMYKLLSRAGIEPNPDRDGHFFRQMSQAGWKIRGERVFDWKKAYEARVNHTEASCKRP